MLMTKIAAVTAMKVTYMRMDLPKLLFGGMLPKAIWLSVEATSSSKPICIFRRDFEGIAAHEAATIGRSHGLPFLVTETHSKSRRETR